MSGNPQYDFITTELDLELLATPFQVQTRWHVLTGAACSGKTTIIEMLADKGFQTLPETARQHIDLELSKGRTFEEMFGNAADELTITRRQQDIERQTAAADVVFLDRAYPDSLTFFRFCGLNPNEILTDCFRYRYTSVFVLDRLPFRQDGARIDHDATSNLLDKWLLHDYSTLGYDVVRVPVLSPRERLAFILDMLIDQGLL